MVALGILGAIPFLGWLVRAVVRRPQQGILALAVLAPFDGLLVLFNNPPLVSGWKEGLTLATLAATVINPAPIRGATGGRPPSYLPPLLALLALALVSSLWTPFEFLIYGLKIDFFYALVALALWRCPFSPIERDRLVTILMLGASITAVFGLIQQRVGVFGLHGLGYEYDESIRTTGNSILRSFSTFNQPFSFAFYLSFVVALGVPIALTDATRLRNRLFLAITPLLLLAMFGTFVRAAVAAMVVGGLYLVVRGYRPVLVVLPVLAFAVVLAPDALRGSTFSATSLSQRLTGWSTVADGVVERPLGSGIGTTGAAAERLVVGGAEVPETFGLPPERQPYQPDNYYVKRLLELGLPGLWLTVIMLVLVVSSATNIRRRAGPADVAFVDGAIAGLLGAITAALVANYWEIFPLDLFFWITLGALTSIERHESSIADWPSSLGEAASRPTLAAS